MDLGDCCVSLFTTDTLLRYKSEWDPTAHAHTKGGYLDGEIRIPQCDAGDTLTMILETYPAEDVPAEISNLHPCMLHVVRLGSGKRWSSKEPVPTKTHWRQKFQIKNGQVWVINDTSELDVEKDGSPRCVPKTDLVTELQGNSIILSGVKDNLNLVFLKPKQTKCDATISKILGDRLGIYDEEKLKQYTKYFIGKDGGNNLTRIRLKASFYNISGKLIAEAISPQTVVDNGSKKIGCMEMYDVWPRRSCDQGGRKVMMISEYDLADDVRPYFEVYDALGNRRHDVEERKLIFQPEDSPETMTVQHTSIIFLTPPQPNLEVIRSNIGDFYIKLVAKRKSDGHTSRGFNFQYSQHIQCDHTVDGKDAARIEPKARAKPKCKKRSMGDKKPNTTTPEKIFRIDEDEELLKSSLGGSPIGVFEMPSPSHSSNSTYDMSCSPRSAPMESYQTVTISKEEIDDIQIPSDLPDIILDSGLKDTSVSEDEVRNMLGWARDKKEEKVEEDQWSNSSVEMVQDDYDILNTINKDDLLNICSPENFSFDIPSKHIPNVLLKPQDPMMSGGIKTPVFFQPRETIFRDSSQKEIKDVHDDDQTVNLGEREKNETKEISTEVDGRSPLLEDLPMLFVVLFMITFCIVQLSCGLFGFQTDNFLLMMVSTLSSLGGITGYWMKSVRQETKQTSCCNNFT